MFSPEYRKRLKYGKYTRWAVDLTEDQLEALFWAIGEYGYRASDPLEVLRRYSPTKDGSYGRYMTGLLTIAEFVDGKTTDLNSFLPRLQSARFPDREEPPPVSSAYYHDGHIIEPGRCKIISRRSLIAQSFLFRRPLVFIKAGMLHVQGFENIFL